MQAPSSDWSPVEILMQTPKYPALSPLGSEMQQNYLHFYDIAFEKTFNVTQKTTTIGVNQEQIHLHWIEHLDAHNAKCPSLIFLHGLFDHAGLFAQAYRHFLGKGFNLLLVDLPGHGLSTGTRACIRTFSDYDDVLKQVLAIRFELSQGPWLGVGQSTGCAIWINHMVKKALKKPPVDALLLCAPLVKPANYPWVKLLYRLIHPFKDTITRDFKPNTQNPTFNAFIKDRDPLQARRISAKWVGAMLTWTEAMLEVLKTESYQSLHPDILIVQGTEDKTVDWPFNLHWLHKVLPNADIKKIQQAGHHCLNETPAINEQLWAEVDPWLNHLCS